LENTGKTIKRIKRKVGEKNGRRQIAIAYQNTIYLSLLCLWNKDLLGADCLLFASL